MSLVSRLRGLTTKQKKRNPLKKRDAKTPARTRAAIVAGCCVEAALAGVDVGNGDVKPLLGASEWVGRVKKISLTQRVRQQLPQIRQVVKLDHHRPR